MSMSSFCSVVMVEKVNKVGSLDIAAALASSAALCLGMVGLLFATVLRKVSWLLAVEAFIGPPLIGVGSVNFCSFCDVHVHGVTSL